MRQSLNSKKFDPNQNGSILMTWDQNSLLILKEYLCINTVCFFLCSSYCLWHLRSSGKRKRVSRPQNLCSVSQGEPQLLPSEEVVVKRVAHVGPDSREQLVVGSILRSWPTSSTTAAGAAQPGGARGWAGRAPRLGLVLNLFFDGPLGRRLLASSGMLGAQLNCSPTIGALIHNNYLDVAQNN